MKILHGFAFFTLAACGGSIVADDRVYSPPEASGLIGVRAYPGPDDVCQVIGENALTVEYLGDASLLVGCPSAETGAIADRMVEGGQVVTTEGDWTLISIPQR